MHATPDGDHDDAADDTTSDAQMPTDEAAGLPADDEVEQKLAKLESDVAASAAKQKEPILQQWLLVLPRLVRFLWRVAKHDDISVAWKSRAVVVLLYVFSPLDLIPDFVPVVGLLDDLYLALLLLDRILNHFPAPIFDACWEGPRDALDSIRDVLAMLEKFLPVRVRKLLDGFFGEPGAATP